MTAAIAAGALISSFACGVFFSGALRENGGSQWLALATAAGLLLDFGSRLFLRIARRRQA